MNRFNIKRDDGGKRLSAMFVDRQTGNELASCTVPINAELRNNSECPM